MQIKNPIKILLTPSFAAFDLLGWRLVRWILRDEYQLRNFNFIRFFGNSEFLNLAENALEEIKRIDPQIHKEILSARLTLSAPWRGRPLSSTIRNRYTIEGWLCDDGIDGIIFAIVTYYSQYRSKQKLGWFKTWVLKPEDRVFESLDFAIDWLRRNSFTEESISVLENIWYKRMFGKDGKRAYQVGAHNSGGCAPSA